MCSSNSIFSVFNAELWGRQRQKGHIYPTVLCESVMWRDDGRAGSRPPVAGSGLQGSKAPLQRPDAPQWRARRMADTAGDESKFQSASVAALNQTSAHKEDLRNFRKCAAGLNSGGKSLKKITGAGIYMDSVFISSGLATWYQVIVCHI